MGDPKKTRKTYQTPSHPWNKERIDEEKILLREFGLKNKKEIWKMEAVLRNAKSRAKLLSKTLGDQSTKEEAELLQRLKKLGILKTDQILSDVLGLHLKDVLERRLQTQVYKKMLANSMKQSRQFITHGHVLVNDKKITSPAFLVSVSEEATITFVNNSSLSDPEHPERVAAKKEEIVEVTAEAPKEEKEEKEVKTDKKPSKKKETKPKTKKSEEKVVKSKEVKEKVKEEVKVEETKEVKAKEEVKAETPKEETTKKESESKEEVKEEVKVEESKEKVEAEVKVEVKETPKEEATKKEE